MWSKLCKITRRTLNGAQFVYRLCLYKERLYCMINMLTESHKSSCGQVYMNFHLSMNNVFVYNRMFKMFLTLLGLRQRKGP